jgi:hypothetical protein
LEEDLSMKRLLLALALAAAMAVAGFAGLFEPAAAEAAKCWTYCCPDGPPNCVTCCAGQPCPNLACF